MNLLVRRLRDPDADQAAAVSHAMACVFEESGRVSAAHLEACLKNEAFWLFGAFAGTQAVGGLTAHVIPMTREPGSELFIYDIAVAHAFQRQGIGRQLMQAALHEAAQHRLLGTFVLAEADDGEAQAFYRRLGGAQQSVSLFNFRGRT